jgi:curved DNA-binding protein
MSANEFVDFYDLLQLSSIADTVTIERIFRHLAKKLHPDQSDQTNNDQFIKIVEAYEALSDPETRAGYDARYQDYWNRKWKQEYQWLATCLR